MCAQKLWKLSKAYFMLHINQRSPLPISHVAQCVVQAGNVPPGRKSVRYAITRLALIPPSRAVTVTYIRSLAAAVIARSTPPGIAELLQTALTRKNQATCKWSANSRIHCNTANSMKDIRSLSCTYAHCDRHLKA